MMLLPVLQLFLFTVFAVFYSTVTHTKVLGGNEFEGVIANEACSHKSEFQPA
jgi:hypothetical protein